MDVQGGGALCPSLCMSNFHDDIPEEPATAVSVNLTEQMLHLTNRFEEERLKLEERTFRAEGGDEGEAGSGDDKDG